MEEKHTFSSHEHLHTDTHTHMRTQEHSHYPLNEPPNGAREWRELTGVETKTRLVHRQRDMWDLTQRSQISACGRDVNQFMRIFGKKRQLSFSFHRLNTVFLIVSTSKVKHTSSLLRNVFIEAMSNFWMSSLSAAFCKDFWFRLTCLVKLFLTILEI